MKLKELITPPEQLISFDIGSGNIKMLEIDITKRRPQLTKLSLVNFSTKVFNNNIIVEKDMVADAIASLYVDNDIKLLRGNVCVPGPSALIKKIRIPKTKVKAIGDQVNIEASSIMPGNINEITIDYHVVGSETETTYDVLVVGVKDEVVDSYVETFQAANVEIAVIDIDYYAINNAFELNYPELKEELIAIVDIGNRFSNIILRQNDEIIYVGDIAIGGKEITTEVMNRFDLEYADAEKYKMDPSKIEDKALQAGVRQLVEDKVGELAKDFSRQLKLFWGSSGAQKEINQIFLTGGGGLISGFAGNLEQASKIETFILDPFRALDVNLDIEPAALKEISPLFTVSVGLGLRQAGDRIIPKE